MGAQIVSVMFRLGERFCLSYVLYVFAVKHRVSHFNTCKQGNELTHNSIKYLLACHMHDEYLIFILKKQSITHTAIALE